MEFWEHLRLIDFTCVSLDLQLFAFPVGFTNGILETRLIYWLYLRFPGFTCVCHRIYWLPLRFLRFTCVSLDLSRIFWIYRILGFTDFTCVSLDLLAFPWLYLHLPGFTLGRMSGVDGVTLDFLDLFGLVFFKLNTVHLLYWTTVIFCLGLLVQKDYDIFTKRDILRIRAFPDILQKWR